MTQHNPGKHIAVRRRAVKRPPLKRAVPLGALLVATTGAVAAVALPGDSDAPATSSATSAHEAWQPPAPQVVTHGSRVAPAAFVTPPAGRHRAKPSATRPTAATSPIATAGSTPRISTGGKHRADVAHPSSTGHSAPATHSASGTHAAPAPTSSGSSGSSSNSGSSSGSSSSGSGSSTVGSVVGTVETTVNGLVGGLVPGSPLH